MKKRSLLSLVMALVLVVGAAFGTYAWFTDSAVSKDNTVTAGIIDVNLDVNGGIAEAEKDIFTSSLVKPGDIISINNNGQSGETVIEIKNDGDFNMAYVWKFITGVNTELANVIYFEDFKVDYLNSDGTYNDEFKVVENGTVVSNWHKTNVAHLDGTEYKLSLADWMTKNNEWNITQAGLGLGALKKDCIQRFTFKLKFAESATSSYKDKSMTLKLAVNATQVHEDRATAERALKAFYTSQGITTTPDYNWILNTRLPAQH